MDLVGRKILKRLVCKEPVDSTRPRIGPAHFFLGHWDGIIRLRCCEGDQQGFSKVKRVPDNSLCFQKTARRRFAALLDGRPA